MARTHEDEITKLVGPRWLKELGCRLAATAGNDYVFVEIPYAFCDNKRLYRHVGGRVIYVGCDDQHEHMRRIAMRGGPDHSQFAAVIPDREATDELCDKELLYLRSIDTSGSLESLKQTVERFIEYELYD